MAKNCPTRHPIQGANQ
jgi:hypothetical protein